MRVRPVGVMDLNERGSSEIGRSENKGKEKKWRVSYGPFWVFKRKKEKEER